MNTRSPAGRLLAGLTILVLLAGCAAGASPTPTPAPSSAPSLAVTTPAATLAATAAPELTPTPTPAPTATPAPSPTAVTFGPVTVVTGTSDCPSFDFGTVTTDSKGVQHSRGGTFACTQTVNDPRVSGASTATWNLDWWGTVDHKSGALVQWGTGRLVNAGGAWEGRSTGVYSSDRGDMIATWFKGTGGYAGLAYFTLESGWGPWTIQGQIFPGAPPSPEGVPPVSVATPSPTIAAGPATPSSPTPTAITFGPVTVVTGTSDCPSIDPGTVTTDSTGVQHGRSGTVACTHTVNDPRVSGAYTATWNADWWGTADHTSGALAQWGTVRLVNAGGAWEGHYTGVFSSDRGDMIATWYKGTRGYAGLTYFTLESGAGPWTIQGQIFPGNPPTP